jgi:phosphocarrier protein
MVKAASRFKSDITISRDDRAVNGKSIMGVMMLAAEHGAMITLRASGPDAEDALESLSVLVASRFGES